MKRKQRITAMALAILALFIFCGSPFQHSTQAIVVDASLIGIIVAALAALGITFTAVGSFGDVTQYVEGLLEEYAHSRGLTVNGLFDGVQTGSNKLGDILLNNRFVRIIDAFAKFIVAKFSLTNNDSKTLVTPGASISGLILYRLPIVIDSAGGTVKDKGIMVITSDEDVYVAFGSDGDSNNSQLIANCISDGNATLKFADVNSSGVWSTGYERQLAFNDDYGKYYYAEGYVKRLFNISQLYVYTQTAVQIALSQNVTTSGKQIDVNTGVITYPTDTPDFGDETGAILDVGGSWGESYDEITDYQIPVGYQDSEIEYETEEEVASQIEDTPAQSISQEVNDYQVNGLGSVFPFCIPFDIYNFFECLAATPVAPYFEWRFYVPGICDETIELDLSQFDTVAQIVRTMELLAFIVGLAFVTRDKMIKG